MNKHINIFIILALLTLPLRAQDTKENADFKLAVSLYNDKLYDLAHEQFRAFINQYPTSAQSIEARFYLGLTQLNLKKYDEARSTFQNFALSYSEHPKAPEAWYKVAESFLLMEKKQEAALAFERVKTFHPKNKLAPQSLLRAAEIYEQINDRENLKRTLLTLIQEYSTNETLPARLKLSDIYVEEGKPEQAIQEARVVWGASASAQLKAQSLLVLSKAFRALGYYTDALKSLTEIITKYPTTEISYQAQYEIGTVYKSYGNIDAARTSWEKLMNNQQVPAVLRQNAAIDIGYTYAAQQNFKKAFSFFRIAGELNGPRKKQAAIVAGISAELSADSTNAATWYLHAYRDSSYYPNRFEEAVVAYKAARFSKRYTDAIRFLRLLIDNFPTEPILPSLVFDGARFALFILQEPTTTIELCDWIVRTSLQSEYIDDAEMLIGKAYQQAGNSEAAINTYKNFLKKYPSSELYEEAEYLIWYIETFEQKSKTSGIEKLASLIGDVVAQRPSYEIAVKVGELFFSDLRNYPKAIEQFQTTLTLPSLPDTLKQQLLFQLARSYEFLGRKDNTSHNRTYLLKAAALYDSLLQLYPESRYAEDAWFYSFSCKTQTTTDSESLLKLENELSQRSPKTKHRNTAYYLLGKALYNAQLYIEALNIFKTLIDQAPAADVSILANFHRAEIFNQIDKKDSAKILYEQFADNHPFNRYTAQALKRAIELNIESKNSTKALVYNNTLTEQFFYTIPSTLGLLQEITITLSTQQYQKVLTQARKLKQQLSGNIFSYFTGIQTVAGSIYNCAVAYDSLKMFKEAELWYCEYIQYEQTSATALSTYKKLASFAANKRDYDRTSFYIQQTSALAGSVTTQPSNLVYETALMFFNAGKYNLAFNQFQQLQKQNLSETIQRNVDLYIALTNFRLDRLDDANRYAAEYIKKYPKDNEGAALFEFERGSYFLRKGKYPVASQYFNTVVKKFSKTSVVPEAMYWSGRVYELEGKTQQAVAVYDSILKFHPTAPIIPKTRLSLGNAFFALEQWSDAMQHYKIVVETESENSELLPIAMNNLIITYKEAGMYDAALDLVRKYIDRFPTDSTIIDKKIDIGLLYQKLGYYDQAIIHLQSLIVPGNNDLEAELRYYIAECYYLKGNYQQAVLEFLKVPYLVSKVGKIDWVATSYYMAGQSYEKLNKPDQAIQMYRQIIDRRESDSQFKIAAQKEIDRVKTIMGIQ